MKKILILAVVVILGCYLWYRSDLRAPDASSNAAQMVTIPKGSTLQSIADLLEEKGMVRSALAFRLRSRVRGLARALQAGSFTLSPAMDVDATLDALTNTKSLQMKITIPEGFTVSDIDHLIMAKGLASTGAILACAQSCAFPSFDFLPHYDRLADRGGKLEGYLFPDTYFVSVNDFVPQFFLERLLSTFRRRILEEFAADQRTSGRTWPEIITMASLIEEETRGNEEKPIVAGILWKRLDAKMGLGVDASIRYVLDKRSGPLTTNDLAVASPYNLRKFRGLPPGPIANPGLQSIAAALHPQDSPYFYYLHDRNGTIHYAVTNDEHNVNKARFLH